MSYSESWISLKGGDVAAVLEELMRKGRRPTAITVDNGSEFTSKELDTLSYLNDVSLDFIRPGKPLENAILRVLMESLGMNV